MRGRACGAGWCLLSSTLWTGTMAVGKAALHPQGMASALSPSSASGPAPVLPALRLHRQKILLHEPWHHSMHACSEFGPRKYFITE